MEMLTGRVIADAKVNTLKDERQVVNFSVALNAYVKPKNVTEGKQYTTYVNCAYWISTQVAERLTKGCVVEIGGRLYTSAYMNGGDPKASLNCHVNHIKIHHSTKKNAVTTTAAAAPVSDDLPF